MNLSSRPMRILVVAFAAAVLSALAIGADRLHTPDRTLRGMVNTPPRDVSNVVLPDANGEATGFSGPAGGVRLTYFGYTACPDVCPTTLSDLRTAIERLSDSKANRVRVTMVSIDPARDSQDVLTTYMGRFFPADRGNALRTDDQAALTTVTEAFGAAYRVDAPSSAGAQPDVTHSASVYAVDQYGRVVDTWSYGTRATDIAHDLRILIS